MALCVIGNLQIGHHHGSSNTLRLYSVQEVRVRNEHRFLNPSVDFESNCVRVSGCCYLYHPVWVAVWLLSGVTFANQSATAAVFFSHLPVTHMDLLLGPWATGPCSHIALRSLENIYNLRCGESSDSSSKGIGRQGLWLSGGRECSGALVGECFRWALWQFVSAVVHRSHQHYYEILMLDICTSRAITSFLTYWPAPVHLHSRRDMFG